MKNVNEEFRKLEGREGVFKCLVEKEGREMRVRRGQGFCV